MVRKLNTRKYFAISTAIDYPSSKPHLGHVYEKVCADVIARWKRIQEFNVHFSTGLDVHGLKIKKAAEKAGKAPKEFIEEMGKYFKEIYDILNISYDDFINTEEPRHYKVAQRLFQMLYDKGVIYKGKYTGPYCVDCETYYTEKELVNGGCPIHKKPVEMISEESYFFKMGIFQKRLIEHIKRNLNFIFPETRRNEILSRLKEPLRDLSVSRTSFEWGIPIPFDKKHIEFVWLEALQSYITTLGGIDSEKFKKFWGSYIIIGKDIIFHHAVIFQITLLALGLPLSSQIIVHGFINIEGEKLSKARGVTINPFEIVKKYGVDSLRYFLMREIPFGEDGDFSEKELINRLNGDLADNLGNLLNRTVVLVEKNFKEIPISKEKSELSKLSKETLKKVESAIKKFQFHVALNDIWHLIAEANKYINETKPWEIKDKKKLAEILYNLLETLRFIAILIYPFIPETSEKIFEQLGLNKKDILYKNLKWGFETGKVKRGEILFKKFQ